MCTRFDLLHDGVRPLSDGRNLIPRILRHLPQSGGKFRYDFPRSRGKSTANEP